MKGNVIRRKMVRVVPGVLSAGVNELKHGSGMCVEECVNLVRSGGGGLCPAPGLMKMAAGCHVPLATYHDCEGGAYTLMLEEGMLRVWEESKASMHDVGRVDCDVFCALARRGGFTVMTASGAVEVGFSEDGEWSVSAAVREWPEMWLEAVGCGTMTASTQPMALKGIEFSRTEPKMGVAAEKMLATELGDAYRRLASAATTAGVWIAPVAARYHLLGADGECLYSSPVSVISAGGWQCDGVLSAECSKEGADGLNVPPLSLVAESFRIVLRVAPGGAERLERAGVRAVEVTVTPQQHPYDASAVVPWRIVHPTLATPALQTALPGATENFGGRHEYFSRRMIDTLGRMDWLESRLAIVDGPFRDGTMALSRHSALTPDDESKQLAEAWGRQPDYHPGAYGATLLGEIAGGGGFTARCVASSGDMVAWGDVTPLNDRRTSVAELCGGFVDEEYRGVLSVGRSDSTTINMAISGKCRPTMWGACVSYPDSRVRTLDVYVEDMAGGTWHGHAELLPTADGKHAVALDRELAGTAFTLYGGSMPAIDGDGLTTGSRRPGAIVAAKLSSPLNAVSAIECSHSPVLAVEPALRSQSSWDFSRGHLYAFSASGIHAVALNGAKKLLSATTIDRRGIKGREGVAATPEGVMALHPTCEVAQLMRIAASRAATQQDVNDGVAIAWDTAHSRLLALGATGVVGLHDIGRGEWSRLDAGVALKMMSNVGNRVWLRDDDSLYRLETIAESRMSDRRVAVRWKGRIDVADHYRLVGMELVWGGSRFVGSVTAEALPDGSGQRSCKMLEIRVAGALKCALLQPVACGVAAPLVDVTIDGVASGDFRLRGIMLYFRK